MTWIGIRLSSGSRRPQSPKGLPLRLLTRFSVMLTGLYTNKSVTGEIAIFNSNATYPRGVDYSPLADKPLRGGLPQYYFPANGGFIWSYQLP